MAIPRIIHQTFESWGEMPDSLQQNCRAIRNLNPDYEYRFYAANDREEFIRNHYGQDILSAYQRINPLYGAARADFFRYLCIYRLGGIYLDLKTRVDRPFSSVLRQQDAFLLSTWKSLPADDPKREWGSWPAIQRMGLASEFQTWHVCAEPSHSFLEAVIQLILGKINSFNPFEYPTSHEALIHTTGPVAYTTAIAPILHRHSHRMVNPQIELGLSYTIFDEDTRHRSFYPAYSNRLQPLISSNSITEKLTYFHYSHPNDRNAIPAPYRIAMSLLSSAHRLKARIRPEAATNLKRLQATP